MRYGSTKMRLDDRIVALQAEMVAWRHDLHAHPETAFEERRTSDFVARTLAGFGFEVTRGIAKTGVVGTLSVGQSRRAVVLRADMDALHLTERTTVSHKSKHDGRMHACGHDGHMAMLLGAAKVLASTRRFEGAVHVVFQPAEENEGGGRVMVEEGLFTRFPTDAVYGLHNWPSLPAGTFGVLAGPAMAAYDVFEITVRGKGSHGAMPQQGVDPIVAAAHLVTALQTVVSRNTDPLESAVLSVTEVHGGHTWNVIPEEVVLRGTTRAFRPERQDAIEAALRRITTGVMATFGATAEVRYERRYPPTINSPQESDLAARAAVDVVGEGAVHRKLAPSMGAEDFAFMLRERPGCYAWLGAGRDGGSALHNPEFDFNDAVLPIGASWWVRVAERALSDVLC